MITDPDILSLKFLHIFFDKYLRHMLVKFEQNRVIRNKQTFCFLAKNGFPFWDFLESVDVILKDVSVTGI